MNTMNQWFEQYLFIVRRTGIGVRAASKNNIKCDRHLGEKEGKYMKVELYEDSERFMFG